MLEIKTPKTTCKHKLRVHNNARKTTLPYTVRCVKCKAWWDISRRWFINNKKDLVIKGDFDDEEEG